jgi:hypothetical protein
VAELTQQECLEIFKKYDPDAFEYYSNNAWYFGYNARRYAKRLLKENEG